MCSQLRWLQKYMRLVKEGKWLYGRKIKVSDTVNDMVNSMVEDINSAQNGSNKVSAIKDNVGYDMSRVHSANLKILKEIDRICRKYKIQYALDAGTLIGAVRHKGFIPWDDDADIVFITHDHYDHYSEEDIDKVINENTTIIIPEELLTKLLRKGINKNAIITVEPNEKYIVQGIKFETIPAYNTNKTFHPKENGWIGYIITLDDIRYYIAGDTDITEENRKVKCDVAFVPVGGTYTMDFKEAAQLINEIQPKIAVPIHYGSVVGTKQDAINFIKLLNPTITGVILMK